MKISGQLCNKLAAVLVSAGLLAGASGAARAVTIELMLAIDASGSISDSQFALQRDAYVDRLNALVPTDGTVALEPGFSARM